jgi:GTPase SAR1 family protein
MSDDKKKTKIEDPIVLSVMGKFYKRSQVGIKKYGTTLDRTDLTMSEWITHAQEEAMDLVLYLERLKAEVKEYESKIRDNKK